MPMTRRILIVSLAALALTGCSQQSQQGYPVLDREQTEQDVLPASFDEVDLSDYDATTSRYSGSHKGSDYFLLSRKDGQMPCLAIAGEDGPMVACGGTGWVEATSADGTRAQLVPEPAVGRDGWVAVGDNVLVLD